MQELSVEAQTMNSLRAGFRIIRLFRVLKIWKRLIQLLRRLTLAGCSVWLVRQQMVSKTWITASFCSSGGSNKTCSSIEFRCRWASQWQKCYCHPGAVETLQPHKGGYWPALGGPTLWTYLASWWRSPLAICFHRPSQPQRSYSRMVQAAEESSFSVDDTQK